VHVLTKDITLCVSLAARPSNNGTRFHSLLYDEPGLDFLCKAFALTNLAAAVAVIQCLGIRGAGVSRPFKEAVIALLDELDASAAAVATLLRERRVDPELDVAVLGSGGMAKAVLAALRDHGHTRGVVVARNARTGRALAQQYGVAWAPALGERRPRLLAHATPVGMPGGPAEPDLPVDLAVVEAAETVLEVVATPRETPLARAAARTGATLVTGGEVLTLQALEQVVLYTGVRPSPDQVARAAAYARA